MLDATPCPISELPQYSCHDCVHNLHGKHVNLDTEFLSAVMGPASYGTRDDPARYADTETGVTTRQLEAQVDSGCDFPDCTTGKIKAGDAIAHTDDYGWVHARHVR